LTWEDQLSLSRGHVAHVPTVNTLAGLSLGIVIGWFAGLSASPVVGALIATLSSAGMAFISLKHSPDRAALTRIVGFSVGCVIAATVGVYVRSNNLLGLTPRRAIAHWRDAGINADTLAADLDVYLAKQISMGRTLTEITMLSAGAPSHAKHIDAEKSGEEPKDDQGKSESDGAVVPLGLGAMFSQPKGPAVSACIDQLEKHPSWDAARRAYLAIPESTAAQIAWIDSAPVSESEKVTTLLVWLKAFEAHRRQKS
jgi:hypothetical protein